MNIRERVKRRVGFYKGFCNGVLLLDTNFKHIFSKLKKKYNTKSLDLIIRNATEEELITINQRIDVYQIDEKMEKSNHK
jgi:hypothetical protein